MKDTYLTSTFTNKWNVDFNPKIGSLLEEANFSCYLPHRDTDQKSGPANIFSSDLKGIEFSQFILAIALNESPNWGAEIGYAYTLKKPIIALTDEEHQIPLICNGMITEVVRVSNISNIDSYKDKLIEILNKYKK